MRDFDYFKESNPVHPATLAALGDLPDELQEQAEALVAERRRYARLSIAAAAFFLVATWFVFGFRDQMAYAFSSPRPPLRLGEVVGLSPADIPHNQYVELSGITEHRGLTQSLVHGVGFTREERWFFRLVGSRGVFIETPADAERYGRTMGLTVRGRAIDPRREAIYDSFLAQYHGRFRAQERPELRIILVGAEPGQGGGPFVVLLALVSLLGAANAWTLRRYVLARQKQPPGFAR